MLSVFTGKHIPVGHDPLGRSVPSGTERQRNSGTRENINTRWALSLGIGSGIPIEAFYREMSARFHPGHWGRKNWGCHYLVLFPCALWSALESRPQDVRLQNTLRALLWVSSKTQARGSS